MGATPERKEKEGLPTVTAEGQRSAVTAWRVIMPEVTIQSTSKSAEIQAATTITAAETVIGSVINCIGYHYITIWVDYTKGDETSYDIIPKFMPRPSQDTDEFPYGVWSPGATSTFIATKFQMTATGKYYIVLDIKGIPALKLYGDATGGTPNGTAQISYTLFI